MPYKAVLKRGMANQPQESTETTHFSMMDGEGNTLASTQTINGFFGSGIYVPELGIMLNNEMDDFATKVGASNIYGAIGGKPNLVEPGKRPLSSMSPTIVLDQNGIGELSIGSPSGTRIITCVAQSMANIYFYKQDLYQAISAARIHQQWMPDKLFVEKDLVTTKTQRELSSYGHQVVAKDLGCRVQGIMRKDGQLEAVSDPRQYGQVAGF
jgi:gamma-glutamyltranspeptidase/glutathione hydrolase